MVISVHQPDYLPYLGFFDKMKKSDIFVIFDDAQFKKGIVHNRQRVRTNQGWTWLTIPVKRALRPINETEISYESGNNWAQHHWNVIENSYKKAPYFEKYAPEFKKFYDSPTARTLADFNIPIIEWLADKFEIKLKIRPFPINTELNMESKNASELLAKLAEYFKADTYLSGKNGPLYLEMKYFEEHGIKVEFQEFHHPEYTQYHTQFDNKFEPYMGAIDALFNIGKLPF